MRRAVLNTYIDLLGQPDVVHAIRESPGRHVAFLGAGVSKEANVPLAGEICDEIRNKLLTGRNVENADAWAKEHLNWDDPRRRYTACLDAYGSAEQRVAYFRRLLRDARPAFAHHGTALLMSRGILFETALTTNFDKLLERAFIEQGSMECQAIRTPEEGEFWGEEDDKCYVFKLHGDYDTLNILNTRPETRSIPDFFLPHALSFLRARGLLVLGSAANEESIVDFLKIILADKNKRVLSAGVRWGVFVGPRRPVDMTTDQEIDHLQAKIEGGAVSLQVVELLADMNSEYGDRRPCSFFPVWGSGNLLLELIQVSDDMQLHQEAQLLLDHPMRLHATFREQKLDPKIIDEHIDKLLEAQKKLGAPAAGPDQPVQSAFRAVSDDGKREIRIAYGDVTSESMMGDPEFAGMRRAVVSPEDTTISAGGGVALRLLSKAGPRNLLNELSKLSPIDHGTCAVTSAGKLPLPYIFHAAALRICPDGSYDISSGRVEEVTSDILHCAEALKVGALFVPLLGAGVANRPASESLKAILSAIATSTTALERQCITIVIFMESIVSRDDALGAVEEKLTPGFVVSDA